MPNILYKILVILLIIILLMLVAMMIGGALFNRRADNEVKQVIATAVQNQKDYVEAGELAGLPLCVAKWLKCSKVIGKGRIHSIRIIQQGMMRTAPDKFWVPLEAVQYVNVDQPGFVWKAQARMAPFTNMFIRDMYYQGQGSMKGKLFAIIPVINAEPCQEMNQGAMLRFMAEMIWYPTAALNDYMHWEEIDANSARATMTWKGVTAAMVFKFNQQGDMISNLAARYQAVNGHYELHNWGGIARGYRDFSSIRLQSKTDVLWKYESGDFNWLQLEVTDIQFNCTGRN